MQQLRFKTSTSKLHSGLPLTFKLDSQTFTLRLSNSIRRPSTLRLSNSIRRPSRLRPSNSIRRPSRSDLQTRFADLHAPTFKLDSPTFTLRPSNSIRRPSRSDFQTRFADLHAPTFKLDWQSLGRLLIFSPG